MLILPLPEVTIRSPVRLLSKPRIVESAAQACFEQIVAMACSALPSPDQKAIVTSAIKCKHGSPAVIAPQTNRCASSAQRDLHLAPATAKSLMSKVHCYLDWACAKYYVGTSSCGIRTG